RSGLDRYAVRLAASTDSGALAAIRIATCCVRARRSASGTTSLTSPISWARRAVSGSPVSRICKAIRGDQPGQRRGPRRAAPNLPLPEGERRGLRGDAQVTALGEQDPAGPRDTVHRGDGRLGHLDVAAELGHEVRRRHGERGLGHLLQVAAGAERLLAGAGEHQDPGGVVLVEAPDPGPRALPPRRVERVASLRPLDGEPGDAALDPVADRLRHRTTPRVSGITPHGFTAADRTRRLWH